jgi:hypothetical protein
MKNYIKYAEECYSKRLNEFYFLDKKELNKNCEKVKKILNLYVNNWRIK